METLTSPTSPVMASNVPSGVRTVTAVSNRDKSALSTYTSASSALFPCVAYVTMGTAAAASAKYAASSNGSSPSGAAETSRLMTARCLSGSVSRRNSSALAFL